MDLRLDVASEPEHGALYHASEQERLEVTEEIRTDVHGQSQSEGPVQTAEVDSVREQPFEHDVGGPPENARPEHDERHAEDGQDHDDDDHGSVTTESTREAARRSPEVLRLLGGDSDRVEPAGPHLGDRGAARLIHAAPSSLYCD